MRDLVLSADNILSHPRFADCRQAYIDGMLRLREYKINNNQPLLDQGRVFVFFTIIMMHANFRIEERATWPTVETLKRQMEKLGVSSGRRVHDITQRFIDTGLLVNFPLEGDRRVKLLTPTEAMLSLDRQSLAVYFKPLDIMFPVPGYREPVEGDPFFQKRARQIGPTFMSLFNEALITNRTMSFFMPRQGGMMVITKLMKFCYREDGSAAAPISFVDLGESFGLSRTHIRRLLREAATEGLVKLDGYMIELSDGCRADFDRFLADTMTGHDLVYRSAKQILHRDQSLSTTDNADALRFSECLMA